MALTKLTISPFKDIKCKTSAGKAFTVMFNPEKYTRTYAIDYSKKKKISGQGRRKFFGLKPETISLEFVFDTTGVVPAPQSLAGKTVPQMLDDFKKTTFKVAGSTHRPNFLQISWGTLLFNCQLHEYTVEHTLFKDDGTSIRAKVKADFLSAVSAEAASQSTKTNSPDLTHTITVKSGDTLPALCNRFYRDPTLYMEVARVNLLTSAFDLKPGTVLQFPPLNR